MDVLEAAWPTFLAGAGIHPAEAGLSERVRVLQVLRMDGTACYR